MNSTNCKPEAYISSKKNRQPHYDGKVYLKDGQEFELELFNPTANTVGVLISINGKTVSNSKLVIRPGMRYFLDRYVDEARKLAFSVYEAENSVQGKAATALNGIVEISFYDEVPKPVTTSPLINNTYYNTTPPYTPFYGSNPINPPTSNPWWTYTNTTNINESINSTAGNQINTTRGTASTSTTQTSGPLEGTSTCCYFSADLSGVDANTGLFNTTTTTATTPSATFETGRIEKGGNSSQSFTDYYGDFSYFPSHSVKLQILPESVKAEQLRTYCKCGKKAKRGKHAHKYCSACGEKL